MWMAYLGTERQKADGAARYAIAVSDTPFGPFKFVSLWQRKPRHGSCRLHKARLHRPQAPASLPEMKKMVDSRMAQADRARNVLDA